jgi:hypothetical protein
VYFLQGAFDRRFEASPALTGREDFIIVKPFCHVAGDLWQKD